MSELQPTFLIAVHLDGDDDPKEATGIVLQRLTDALVRLKEDGVIRSSMIGVKR